MEYFITLLRRSVQWVALATAAACVAVSLSSTSGAQDLLITELMIDPNDTGAWEWLEVRNTTGADIDLNGYYADRLGDPDIISTGSPNIQNTVASNTIVPANGVAIIYDGFLGAANPATHDDSFFQSAWGLDASVKLISTDFFPALTNSGTAIGFWENRAAYDADLIDPNLGGALCGDPGVDMNTCEVGGFANAAFSIDFNGFPTASGQSTVWSGNGSNQNAANWASSVSGTNGAVTSSQVIVIGGGADVANPGIPPVGTPPAASAAVNTGIFFTEIQFNSGLAEDDWEWVEIYNNTGGVIDFGSTPYVFDDDDNPVLGAANITSGTIGIGEVAVLFNVGDVSAVDFANAWDPGGNIGTTFIGVSDWPALGNSGDVVALWDDIADYNSESAPGDTQENAVAALFYDDDGLDWPIDNNSGSHTLGDLGNDTTAGLSWNLSNELDGISFKVAVDTVLHPGGDVGSPGSFTVVTLQDVDLDIDGDVDGQDFLLIQQTNPALIPDWEAQYAGGSLSAVSAVPEPSSIALIGLALVMVPVARRQRG